MGARWNYSSTLNAINPLKTGESGVSLAHNNLYFILLLAKKKGQI